MIHHYTKKNLDTDNLPNTQHKFENRNIGEYKRSEKLSNLTIYILAAEKMGKITVPKFKVQ